MLQHLHISNYALIEKLDINFSNGFSVITGETGAGKSIILGALGLIMGQRADAKVIKTLTTHNIYDAEGRAIDTVRFDANNKESSGTNKVIKLSGPIFDTLLGGKVLFVDELDSKLHPMMTRAIVRLFMDKETNPHGAQLVFTTHDTHLLNMKYLRRDQVWFTEKDPTEASDLYSLLDFKVRNDRDIENDYINGRYGAIPFIK